MGTRVVLVTGGNRGIGKAIAEKFIALGDRVVISYNSGLAEAERFCESMGCDMVKADVGIASDCQGAVDYVVKKYGRIDVLINNAGMSFNKLLIDTDCEEMTKLINVNLIGVMNMSKFACKAMLAKGAGGNIINISSIWGKAGASMETVYSASKGGVNAFTRALAKEMALSNIRVNAIAPGAILTDMLKGYTAEELDGIKSLSSLERLGTPQEIASLAAFLAGEGASFITGQCISCDGLTV